MKKYDFIIAGGGAAGLSLAYHLVKSPLAGKSILIIDKETKSQNDRTWCFWTQEPTFFDGIAFRTWDRLRFVAENFEREFRLGNYQYRMIRGIDYYGFTRDELAEHPNVSFLQGSVERIEDGPDQARVWVDGDCLDAAWVFDSLFRQEEFRPQPGRYHYLKQHFKGWEVETPGDVFDCECPTLFDFRTPQNGSMRFIYILPYTSRQALVEYTLFSADLLRPEEYVAGLKDYLAGVLKQPEYRILSEENGIIPMTDQPFHRRGGRRILNTGTKGGRVKPSTGYAFLRIQQDSVAIVQSLLQNGHPFGIPRSPGRYRLFDATMLQLMYRQGGMMAGYLHGLVPQQPHRPDFRFLDETGSLLDNLRLMTSLPVKPFVEALWKIKVKRRL